MQEIETVCWMAGARLVVGCQRLVHLVPITGVRRKAESEIKDWRETLQGYIDRPDKGNMRLIARAPLSADGTVASGAQVELFVAGVKQLIPAEDILAAIATAEAAEKEAYADMEQRYGKKS